MYLFCLQVDGPITGVRAYELGGEGGGSYAEVNRMVKYLYLHFHFCIVYGRFAKVLFANF